MHRIDTPTAQKDKFGAGKNGFTRGNPQTGTPATDLDDDYFDMLQEELAGVVEATGVALDKTKHNQLLTALTKLLLTRAHPFADIKADGTAAVAEALSNLGLKDIALAGVASGTLGASGYVTLPLIVGGVRREFIIQWSGPVVYSAATNTVMAKQTWTFPTAFPTACLGVFPTMARGNTYNPSSSPTCSAKDPTLTSVELGSGYYASTSAVIALAIGY